MSSGSAELHLAPAAEEVEWADIGYTRISDDRTGVAASPARQKQAITAEAAAEGRTITNWFEDLNKSAFRPGIIRPQFEAALAACATHPVRRLWVLHDDRLIREGDEDDLPSLIRVLAPRKITIRCVEAADIKLWQAEGKMSARVRNAVNGYESERKRERVVIATQDRARRGRFGGGQRRFGYTQRDTRIVRHQDDDGVITETERPSGPLLLVPAEAQAIADAYQAIATGETLYAVVKDWRARGLTGPRGAPFTDISVRDILLRASNAGLSTYKGEVVGTGEWPAIPGVNPDLFFTVKAILDDPSRKRGPGKPPSTLLGGVLWCARCGEKLAGAWRGVRKDGSTKRTYACREGHVGRARPAIDEWVSELVVGHLEERAGALARPREDVPDAIAQALGEAAEVRGHISAYQARAAEFDPADLAAILRSLRAKLARAEAKSVTAAGTPASSALAASGDIWRSWVEASTEQKRTAIMEQVEKIVVGPAKRGPVQPPGYNIEVVWRED
jgi:site-specific DNA recombinase